MTAALCVFPPSSLGCGENLMTSSLKNVILNEHNDRRAEMGTEKKLKRLSLKYQACIVRGSRPEVSRCPGPPFYNSVRRDKVVKEMPYCPLWQVLVWNSELASRAQSYAEKLACIPGGCTSGSLTHDYSHGYGENLKCNSGGRFRTQDKAMIERLVMDMIDSWWGEFRIAGDKIGEYLRSMPDGEMNYKIGHFAQMAWAETTKVGCGVQRNDSKMVCVYRVSQQVLDSWLQSRSELKVDFKGMVG